MNDLDALAHAHDLVVERRTFDGGQTVIVRGSIGRLPYMIRETREWGDRDTAESAALVTLRKRLGWCTLCERKRRCSGMSTATDRMPWS